MKYDFELKKIKRKKMNKRGQFEDGLYAVVIIVVIGIILFFFNHLNHELYQSFDSNFADSDEYNTSEIRDTSKRFVELEESNMWDWAFLAIYFGIIIQMLILSFATRINIAFFWIYVLTSIIILIVGVVLSNVWIELSENPTFVDTIQRFPITNMILGNYFPVVVLALIFLVIILLFGKPPGN